MNNKNTIIFDFDGTLANTYPHILKIINGFAKKYGYYELSLKESKKVGNLTYKELIRKYKIPIYKIPFLLHEGKVQLNKEIEKIDVFPGIKKVINNLKKKKFTLGILSSNSIENIEKFLKKHDLMIFDFIVSELNLFGKDRALKNLIKKYHLDIEKTIYVGDEIRDIEACKKVGLEIISVTWGFNSKEFLEKSKPTYLIEKAEEILEII